MSNEYIQNMMGSPYIDEASFGPLKSKMAQGFQNIGAVMGGGIELKAATKIRPQWEDFYNSLYNIMYDWVKEGEPSITVRRKAGIEDPNKTPEYKQVIDALNSLADSVQHPYSGEMLKTIHGTGVTNYPKQKPVYGKGKAIHTYDSSQDPKNQPIAKTHSPMGLKDLAKESARSALKRQFTGGGGVNKALWNQDVGAVLNSYKNQVIKLYNNFLKYAVKATGNSKQNVIQVVKKMLPKPKAGFIPSGNMENVINNVTNLELIADVPTTKKPIAPVTPVPVTPVTAPAAPTTPTASTTAPSNVPSAGNTGMGGTTLDAGVGNNVIDKNPDKVALIIERVIDIIISAVQQDEARSEIYFSKDPLPKEWDQSLQEDYEDDPINEDEDEDELGKRATAIGKKEQDHTEYPGKFLYNFHSRFDKQRKFSIEIPPYPPILSTIELDPSDTRTLKVVWHNVSARNDILVTETKNGQSKISRIFRFFNQDVIPQSEAGKNFNIEELLNDANPRYVPLLKKANPAILTKIKDKTDTIDSVFGRALFAVVSRKAKEFKSKKNKDGTLNLEINSDGSVVDNSSAKPKTYDVIEVKRMIYSGDSTTRKLWNKSLEELGYFERYPGMKYIEPEERPQVKEAVNELVSHKIATDNIQALPLVVSAWNLLFTKLLSPDKITMKHLYDSVKVAMEIVQNKVKSGDATKQISSEEVMSDAVNQVLNSSKSTDEPEEPAIVKGEKPNTGFNTANEMLSKCGIEYLLNDEKDLQLFTNILKQSSYDSADEGGKKKIIINAFGEIKEEWFERLNSHLKSNNIETLDNIEQFDKYWKTFHSYNKDEQSKINNDVEEKTKLVKHVKGNKPKSEPDTETYVNPSEMINPFQKSNFL